jgi:hypothetical protein
MSCEHEKAVSKAIALVEALDWKIGGFVIGVMGTDMIRREMTMRDHLKIQEVIDELKKCL